MRISDWSSDVCSSDLAGDFGLSHRQRSQHDGAVADRLVARNANRTLERACWQEAAGAHGGVGVAHGKEALDRKSVGEGKSVSVRVDLGGRRIITKTIIYTT